MNVSDHLRTTGGALKNWAIAQLQDSLAVGTLWWIGLRLLHVPLAPLWALLAALLQIIPHLGPLLGLIGPLLAAAISWKDWQHPLSVLVLYAVVAALDNDSAGERAAARYQEMFAERGIELAQLRLPSDVNDFFQHKPAAALEFALITDDAIERMNTEDETMN